VTRVDAASLAACSQAVQVTAVSQQKAWQQLQSLRCRDYALITTARPANIAQPYQLVVEDSHGGCAYDAHCE
jgi:hypothetical protein